LSVSYDPASSLAQAGCGTLNALATPVSCVREYVFHELDIAPPNTAGGAAMTESLVIVSRQQILRRVHAEYLEMPGLRLTRKQAQRLWGIDEQTCMQILESLTQEKFLYRMDDGTYARLPVEATTFPPLRMPRSASAPRA